MRLRLLTPLVTVCALAAGCSQGSSLTTPTLSPPPQSSDPQAAPAPPAGDGLPVDAVPDTSRDASDTCPYLDPQFVAETNGQVVTGVGVDTRFDPPACQFWSYPEEPQLTVLVRRMGSFDEAMAVVDWAAPIEHTAPADEPEGWNGGRFGGGEVPGRSGAGYAVAKDNVAVVVLTNQDESFKAQVVAQHVIATLGL
ncbi:hypothetical protein CGLAUT_11655 [Corynebacterium glaucum]|nr:hypothetical protein CGLAUT_11655 [Corynebacterium glaucum]